MRSRAVVACLSVICFFALIGLATSVGAYAAPRSAAQDSPSPAAHGSRSNSSGSQTVSSPDFSIVALPDTQMYVQDYPATFTAQTEWIVKNRAALNIKFVVGMGDIVNVGNSDEQWRRAMNSIGVLDKAAIPYTLAIGNHDYDQSDAFNRAATYYNKYNGIDHYRGRSYYGSSTYPPGQNDNFYATMTINGETYVFLTIEYWPRDEALDWARTVLAAYPKAKIIVVTHGYEGADNFRTGEHDCGGPASWGGDNNAEEMWSKVFSQYANIIMVLSGHLPGAGHEFDPGVHGNLVNQIVADYQDDPLGGNGFLRILTFHPSRHTVDVKSYSPTLSTYQTDPANQFTVPLDTGGLDLSKAAIRGRVGAISTGCTTDPVNSVVSFALGTAAPAYVVPDANGYYTTPANLAPGAYTVKANAAGYAPAVLSIQVAPGYTSPARFYLSTTTDQFTLSATPASETVAAGADTRFSATVSSAGTYANARPTLSAIGLPSGASASFSRSTLTGSNTWTVTVSTTSGTPPGTYPVLISGTSGDMQRVASVKLVVTPGDGSTPNHRQWSWLAIAALALGAIVAAAIAVYVITARRRSSS